MIAPKLRLCPGVVLLPLHSPLHVAEELASLDVMCDGKLIFGAGIGYREVEFKRVRLHAETIRQAVRGMPGGGEAPVVGRFRHHEGELLRARQRELPVMPVQKPMPPVWIGANANVGIRRAARMADTWFINPHNKMRYDRASRWKSTSAHWMRRASRFPTKCRWRAKCSSHARAPRRSAWHGHRWKRNTRRISDWGQDKVMPASDHFDLNFEELMDDRFLFGSPAEVTETDHRLCAAVSPSPR